MNEILNFKALHQEFEEIDKTDVDQLMKLGKKVRKELIRSYDYVVYYARQVVHSMGDAEQLQDGDVLCIEMESGLNLRDAVNSMDELSILLEHITSIIKKLYLDNPRHHFLEPDLS